MTIGKNSSKDTIPHQGHFPPDSLEIGHATIDWLQGCVESVADSNVASSEDVRRNSALAANTLYLAVSSAVDAKRDRIEEVANCFERNASDERVLLFLSGVRRELRETAIQDAEAAAPATVPAPVRVNRAHGLLLGLSYSFAVLAVALLVPLWREPVSGAADGAASWLSLASKLAPLLYGAGLLLVTLLSLGEYLHRRDKRWGHWNSMSVFVLICGTQLVDFVDRAIRANGNDVKNQLYWRAPITDLPVTDLSAFAPLVLALVCMVLYQVASRKFRPGSNSFRRFRAALYLFQAWLPFAMWWPQDLFGTVPNTLSKVQEARWLLLAGGIAYTAGALWYLVRPVVVGPRGKWYVTVVVGWVLHYFFVLSMVHGPTDSLARWFWALAVALVGVAGMLFVFNRFEFYDRLSDAFKGRLPAPLPPQPEDASLPSAT